MSVDVSPDGGTVYFDHLGDIYKLPIKGGVAERLVGGMDWSVQPTVSPDGRKLAYVSDRSGSMNLWIYDLKTGKSLQHTHEKVGDQMFFADPQWTPDGEGILVWATRRRNWFLGNLPREIRRYNAEDGAVYESLTGERRASISGAESPSLSPDGRFLYYARFRETRSPFYGDRVLPEWQLEGKDLKTGVAFALTDRHGGAFAPQLSPDGRYIVYGSRDKADTGLRLKDLQTGEDDWLVFPVDRDQQESNFFYNLPGMGFTPDGRALVAGFGGGLNRVDLADGKVTKIPFSVDVVQDVIPLTRPIRILPENIAVLRRVRSPVLSPDRRKIAFVAHDRIWLIASSGGEARRLTQNNISEADPAWSPDGKSIVYVSYDAENGGHVTKTTVKSGVSSRLTATSGGYVVPTFRADGEAVYVTRISGAHPENIAPPYDLLELDVAGGGASRVSAVPFSKTPYPARIHIHGDTMDRLSVSMGNVITSIGRDGVAKPTLMTSFSGRGRPFDGRASMLNTLHAEYVAPSPDGAYILAVVGQHIYAARRDALRMGPGFSISLPDLADTTGPVTRLSKFGGEQPSWSADGKSIVYSLGPKIFRYDMNDAGRFETTPTSVITVKAPLAQYAPEGVLAVKNVRIVTMRGDEIIQRGVIVVENNRIAAVGPRGRTKIPKGAFIVDGRGATVTPGFIDTHAHTKLAPDGAGARVKQPWAYLNYLSYGVTTIHDPAQVIGDLEYGDQIRAGLLLGPRVFGSGPHVKWGMARLKTYDDAKDLLSRYGDHWRTLSLKEYVAGDRIARQWIALAAREIGTVLPVFEGEDFNYNLSHVVDGYADMSHSIGVAPLYDDVVRFLAEAGTSVSYQFGTLRGEGAPSAMYYFMNKVDPYTDKKSLAFMPRERFASRLSRRLEIHPSEHAFPLMARQAAKLMRAGVPVSVGDHGEWGGLGLHWEIWAASHGMTNHEALTMATRGGAASLGLDRDLGTIEPGKLADFLVIDGDPLTNINDTANIRYVVKNGEVYNADTLDRIYPSSKKLDYDPWWLSDAPKVRDSAQRMGGAPVYRPN